MLKLDNFAMVAAVVYYAALGFLVWQVTTGIATYLTAHCH